MAAVIALMIGKEAWIGILSAMVMFVVTSNNNYFNCGNYALLALIELPLLLESLLTAAFCWLTLLRCVLHLVSMRVAYTTYIALKLSHCRSVYISTTRETRTRIPLLSSYSSISEETK